MGQKKGEKTFWCSFPIFLSILVLLASTIGFYIMQNNRSVKIDAKKFAELNECRCKPTLYEELSMAGKSRCELFENVHGVVAEMGSGSGVNFVCWYNRELCEDVNVPLVDSLMHESEKLFCNKIEKYYAIDANEYHTNVLKRNYDFYNLTFDLTFLQDIHELSNDSIDSIVSTHVLCSINDIDNILQEIKRVLKPGGKYYFYEHTRADKGSILELYQSICEPFWCYYYAGCKFIDIKSHLQKIQGMSMVVLKKISDENKKILIAPHIFGVLQKDI